MAKMKAEQHKVRLTPNLDRILAAVSFVIAEAERRKQTATQYEIVKTIFLADKAHLNMWGRPITYDNYYAMKDGPVPTVAYSLLSEDARLMRQARLHATPWRRRPAPEISARAYAYFGADPKYKSEQLSPSDVEALCNAFTIIKTLGFRQIRRLTHDDPAYLDAWKGAGGKRFAMNYALLFETKNEDEAKQIAYDSRNM